MLFLSRPALIVWKEPEETIAQDDVAIYGGNAHVSVKLQPGAYRISVINGSREAAPEGQAFPYTLNVARGK